MLNKQILINALKNMPVTKDKPPQANTKSAQELAKALLDYYKNATAGVIPVTLFDTPLIPLLLSQMTSNTLLETIGTSIQTWALTWTFADATFTGPPGGTIAIGSILDISMSSFIQKTLNDKSDPPKDNLENLANEIHNWSIGGNINVTLINNQSGATSIVPLS